MGRCAKQTLWGTLAVLGGVAFVLPFPAWAETSQPAVRPSAAAPASGAPRDSSAPVNTTVNGMNFLHINAAAQQADRCESRAQPAYESGDQEKILAALTEQRACLEGIFVATAQEFYTADAFGPGGAAARLADLRHSADTLLDPLYNKPRTCMPKCSSLYRVWAAEAYVTTLRSLLDDMLDRLKDESPYYRQ